MIEQVKYGIYDGENLKEVGYGSINILYLEDFSECGIFKGQLDLIVGHVGRGITAEGIDGPCG